MVMSKRTVFKIQIKKKNDAYTNIVYCQIMYLKTTTYFVINKYETIMIPSRSKTTNTYIWMPFKRIFDP